MNRALSRAALEDLYRRHHRLENVAPDPVMFARDCEDPREGEVAGLVAASLAYGQVGKIVETLAAVFRSLGPAPRALVLEAQPLELAARLGEIRYRFHTGSDLAVLLHLAAQCLARHGSLRETFAAGDGGGDIRPAMEAFVRSLFSGDARPLLRTRSVPAGHPVRHLLPSPVRGGAAKRLCLYLRWMVRRDEIDPGYWWGTVDPRRLVVPLDTHVARVGRELQLTARRSADWRTAEEITEALRRYDARDPVRYDFTLFRFGWTGEGALGFERSGRRPPGGSSSTRR